jgi:PAS domain S-box-containing protein
MQADALASQTTASHGFLLDGGEMGARMRAHDWSTSPLGDPWTWPQSLRSYVSLMLNAKQAMFIAWGPELAFLYNDDYAPIFGDKHPDTLGRPFAEAWSDIWEQIGSIVERTLAGEASWYEDLLIPMERHGFKEDAWFSFSYTPIRDESGQVAGMFCAVVETTDKVLAERRNMAERERLQQLFEQAPGFMAMLGGPDHVFELANTAFQQLIGNRDLLHKPVREALPEVVDQGFINLLDKVYRTGQTFTANTVKIQLQRTPQGPAEQRLLNFVYQPITDSNGQVTGIFAEGYDVTEQIQAEQALRESEARHRAIIAATPECVKLVAADGRLLEMNRTGLAMIEAPSIAAVQSANVLDIVAPEYRDEWRANHSRVCHGESISWEFEIVGLKGTRRRMETHAVPLTTPDGSIAQLSVTRDVTERRRAEEHQQLLINELNHRVKNTLATVQSIAAQTLRNASTVAEAKDALEGRLLALSRAHDVLTRENWEGAGLREIAIEAVEPYSNSSENRLHMKGPEVRLPPRMALALAMALQELATNAVKYGALSNATGQIQIGWKIEHKDGLPRLHLDWTESGGPPVKAPKRRGFGTRLIERSLAQDLDGEVRIDFVPTGLVCKVDAPIAEAVGLQANLAL